MVEPLDRQIQRLRQRADTLRQRVQRIGSPGDTPDSTALLAEALEVLRLALDVLQEAVPKQQVRDSQAMLDAIDDGVCLLDLEGTVLRCNPAMADLVGQPPGELIGRSCCELVHGSPEPVEGCPFTRMRHSRRRESMALRLPDRWLQVTVDPVLGEAGELTGAIHIVSDITEQRRAEEAHDALEAQLRQAQKMEAVGRLASGVAHDFNNLLTPILGYSQRLISRLTDEDPRCADARQILKAGQRAASLSRQLLLFSRRQTARLQPLDLNHLVSDMEHMLGRIIGEEIKLVTLLDAMPCRVRADGGQLEQVIMNLALNARDAMASTRGGTLTLRTENVTLSEESRTQAAAWVRLSVMDTGTGMDDEVMGHLFEPFFTTKEQGTGLGLAVAYGIAEQHGGYIHAYSAPGEGSAFEVYLPALGPALAEPGVVEAVTSGEPRGRGEAILVVEDDEWVRQFTAQVLGRGGYTVFEAETVADAWDVLDRGGRHIDLVFSDVVLADGTGLELADQLLDRRTNTRVLLCSGYTDDRSRATSIHERGLPFLQKPYTLSELLQAVRTAMECGETGDMLPGGG